MRLLLVSVLCLLFTVSLTADLSDSLKYAGDGGIAAAWLHLPVGAKAIGAGGAYTVLGEDPTAAFYNPATLVRIPHGGVSLSGTSMSLGRKRADFALAFKGTTAAAHTSVWAISGSYLSVEGLESYSDNSGTPGGSLSAYSFFGQVSFALSLDPIARKGGWGVGLKVLSESLDDLSGFGAALSLGFDYPVLGNFLRFAASLNHLGAMQYGSETIWLNPLLSTAFHLQVLNFPAPLVIQVDKQLGTDNPAGIKLATQFTLFEVKPELKLDPADPQYRKAYGDFLKQAKDKKKQDKKQDGDKQQDTKQPQDTNRDNPDDKPKQPDAPAPKDDKDAIDKMLPRANNGADSRGLSLVMRLALADSRVAGGFTFQWERIELSYALAFDLLEEGPAHHLTLNFNF